MSTHGNDTAPQHALPKARGHLHDATRALAATAPPVRELHATVDGKIRTCTALAEFVATLRTQAPAALDGHGDPDGHLLRELEHDLRAMHGCLTTAPLLLAPARDDLHALTANVTEIMPAEDAQDAGGTARFQEPRMFDEAFDQAAAHDVADQQQPACPGQDDDPDAVVGQGTAEILLEADPADVADQHRVAPVRADDEPWP